MKISPSLIFDGQAEEAANFYADALGGRVAHFHRYADFPPMEDMPPLPEEYKQRVGHCCIESDRFPGGTMNIADTVLSDTFVAGNNQMLTLSVDSTAEAEDVWTKLSVGAQKIMCPLQETFYAVLYGELLDRFGIQWAVMYEKE